MGSVSSVSSVSDAVDPKELAVTIPQESAGLFVSSVSASNATMREHKDLVTRLAALERDKVEFGQVQIYHQPLSAGVADHHQLVYWSADCDVFATAGELAVVRGGIPGLQIDWGQNGLAFSDLKSTPQGNLARSKEVGISPLTISNQLLKYKSRTYNIVNWNCQHFCQQLFDQAGGNSRLNAELDRLHKNGAMVTSASIHQETPGTIGEWTLVYWHMRDVDSLEVAAEESKGPVQLDDSQHGLQICWGADGLDFEVVMDGPPGALVAWRECSTSPARIRRQLREIEGRAFHSNVWNSKLFAQHLFDRILAKGGLSRLHEHLEELSERGVEIAGVLELSVLSPIQRHLPGDVHLLIYKYRLSGNLTCLWIEFSESGVKFDETDEEPSFHLVMRNKPMLFVRLQPKELQRQLEEIQVFVFDKKEWNSHHFCNHLFAQVPGKARDGKSGNRHTKPEKLSQHKPDRPAELDK